MRLFSLFGFLFWARTVSYFKSSVDNGCLKPPFLMSSQGTKVLPEWLRSFQWTFNCFATGRWTAEHLYQDRSFHKEARNKILMWVRNWNYWETLAFRQRKTNFRLPSLCCLGSIERAVPCFSYAWLFEFEHLDVSCLKLLFLQKVLRFNVMPILRPIVFPEAASGLAQILCEVFSCTSRTTTSSASKCVRCGILRKNHSDL